jgi:dienelactone hydrolase
MQNLTGVRGAPFATTILSAALFAVALAGCAPARLRARPEDAALNARMHSGYVVDHRHPTESSRETWTIGGEAVDVSLMLPSDAGSFPLVVYLPGLGEASVAGAAWRRAWAEAGYAVLSVQLARMGEALGASELARAGEFRTLAAESFSSDALATRLGVLSGALAEVERRRARPDAGPFARIDVSRVAVTGFDLGAQAAMVVAGEAVDGVEAPPWPMRVKAVIALSPYADFTGMGLERLFGSVHLPVLSVTGNRDVDAYGLVTSASVRRAPFQYMPPGDKYLLVVSAAQHALLSGRETPLAEPSERTAATEGSAGEASGERQRRGTRAGGRRFRAAGAGDRSQPAHGAAAAWRVGLAEIAQVTTAYLDATVKDDPVAHEWMSRDAASWLGKTAELRAK